MSHQGQGLAVAAAIDIGARCIQVRLDERVEVGRIGRGQPCPTEQTRMRELKMQARPATRRVAGKEASTKTGFGPVSVIDIRDELTRERSVPRAVIRTVYKLRRSGRRCHIGDDPDHRRYLAARHALPEANRELGEVVGRAAVAVEPVRHRIAVPAGHVAATLPACSRGSFT